MFGAILKETNSYFQKIMTLCRSTYVKNVMKLLAFIFEQPSYNLSTKYILTLAYDNVTTRLTQFVNPLTVIPDFASSRPSASPIFSSQLSIESYLPY